MKKLCLLTAALLLLLCGCGKQEEAPPKLWVVTEKTEWNGMNGQAKQMIEVFEEKHPEFTVELDVLPQDRAEREIRLKQIRSQIMSGKGPDVFLMPTDTTSLMPQELEPPDEIGPPPPGEERTSFLFTVRTGDDMYPPQQKISVELEPLIQDVEQVMRGGLFANIGPYYDIDDELGRECLNQAVMDAGTFRGGRYILPIRYDMPVLYSKSDALKKYGLTEKDISGNIMELMDLALASGDQELAAAVEPFLLDFGRGFSLLPQPLDYENSKVAITKETLYQFLHKFQDLRTLVGHNGDHRTIWMSETACEETRRIFEGGRKGGLVIGTYKHKMFPNTYPMRVFTMTDMPQIKFISVLTEDNYAIRPLKNAGDQLTAYVTYWGAVGSGCKYPAEAYEFLSMFLSEDAQFEQIRPIQAHELTKFFFGGVRTNCHLIEDGWPVRVKGSGAAIWKITSVAKHWSNKVRTARFTEEDFPPLVADIDHVTFGCILEQDFAALVRSLNDQDTGEPTDIDIDAAAEQFLEKLLWHVCEG